MHAGGGRGACRADGRATRSVRWPARRCGQGFARLGRRVGRREHEDVEGSWPEGTGAGRAQPDSPLCSARPLLPPVTRQSAVSAGAKAVVSGRARTPQGHPSPPQPWPHPCNSLSASAGARLGSRSPSRREATFAPAATDERVSYSRRTWERACGDGEPEQIWPAVLESIPWPVMAAHVYWAVIGDIISPPSRAPPRGRVTRIF